MKTKIITLESHDDLISVRDKLSWAKTLRILLVWPKYEKVTLRLLDLKVLQRHADSLGAQLGLVTRRTNVKRDAESLGIPVFRSTTSAQKDLWPLPAPRTQRTPEPPRRGLRALRDETQIKEPAWRSSLLGRVVTFSVGVLAVLVLAALFVPKAAVTLYPESRTESIVIPVNADPSISSVSLTGDVPAKTISVTLGVEQTVPATSMIDVPKNKARGVAQFTNLGSDELTIPAGTIVSTESFIRFVTLNDAKLPAGTDSMVEIRIEAMEAGTIGNVDAEEISILEGQLGLFATVLNLEPTLGGSDIRSAGASEEQRLALREAVLADLRKTAEAQMRSELEADDILFLDTLEINEIQREEYSPPSGQTGNSLTLSVQADFVAQYVTGEDLRRLVSSSLTASIPEGFSASGEFTLDLAGTPVTDSSGVTHFQLQAAQTAFRNVDFIQVFSLIRGQEIQSAKAGLAESISMRQEPQVTITPSWWKWLPLIPFNLSLEIK